MTAEPMQFPDRNLREMLEGERARLVAGLPPIQGFIPSTLNNFPGRVAAAIFLGGCNFRCPYCHNPGLVAEEGCHKTIQPEELVEFLERRQGLLDGIVISGGEPTLHEGLLNLILLSKSFGYQVKLDTNGSKPDTIKSVLPYLDYIAMDIKNSQGSYQLTTGREINYDRITSSIRTIIASGREHEFRTTVHSHFHQLKDLLEIVDAIQGARLYCLQLARDTRTLEDIPENKLTPSTLERWQEQLAGRKNVGKVIVRV